MPEQNSAEKVPGVTLHLATEADIEAYIAIEHKVKGRTYSAITTEEGVREEFAKGPVYMIKRGAEIVGMISYEIKEDNSAYISGLTIDPKYQGLGLAKIAMKQVLDEIGGSKKVWLLTHPDNVKAVSLYQSLGFKIGERKENYFGDGEPRIVLTLDRVAS